MTWPARWRPALLAALALMALPRRADAASPDPRRDVAPDGGVEGRRRATITLALQDEARFREVLRAAIETASIDLEIEILSASTRASTSSGDFRPPTPPRASAAPLRTASSGPAAAFQVAVGEGSTWYEINVVDVERDRIYTRRLERDPSGGDEVAHEAAAHVVAYALEALGRGQTIGTPRKQSPRAVDEVTAPSPSAAPAREPRPVEDRAVNETLTSPPRLRLAFGTRTSMTAHAANAPAVFGVGAVTALRFRASPGRSALEIAASAEQHVPTEIRSSNLSSRFQIHSARFFVRYDLAMTRTIGLGPAVGLGVDRIGVTTGPRTAGPDPTISSHDVIGVAAMAFGARAAIASHLRIQLDLGVELPWQHVEYVVQRGSRTLTFLDPWPARPWMSLGLLAEL